jgi:PAS domain S-box-containing protein
VAAILFVTVLAFFFGASVFVNNRRQITLTAVSLSGEQAIWTADLSSPIFGLTLSIGLAVWATLLYKRSALFLSARLKERAEIEKRKKLEVTHTESENRYRNVFNAVTDGLLVLDSSGLIIEANRTAALMHGLNHEEIVGKKFRDLVDDDKQCLVDEFDRQLAQHGQARFDSIHLRKDGSRIDVEVRGSRLIRSGMEQRLAIISDVSDKKHSVERHAALSRKAIAAQEEERARLSMEMHDELGQILTALRLDLGLVRKQHAETETRDFLSNSVSLAEKATNELRRLCKGLRPPLLDDLGLEPAMQLLVDDFETQTDTRIHLVLPEASRPMSREAALCAYRIVQESLTNVRKHAHASQVEISLTYADTGIELCIYDDGGGFEPSSLPTSKGCGLQGIAERANLAGGYADIRSGIGQGTRIVFRAPYFISKLAEKDSSAAVSSNT